MLDYTQAKKVINIFLIKGALVYGILLLVLVIFRQFFRIDLVLIPIIFLFLFLLCFAIWGGINGYVYFVKRKGRSPLNVSWEEMEEFEKEYFIRVRKIWRLYLILTVETLLFIIFSGLFI